MVRPLRLGAERLQPGQCLVPGGHLAAQRRDPDADLAAGELRADGDRGGDRLGERARSRLTSSAIGCTSARSSRRIARSIAGPRP
jgi:hypothetical protein